MEIYELSIIKCLKIKQIPVIKVGLPNRHLEVTNHSCTSHSRPK